MERELNAAVTLVTYHAQGVPCSLESISAALPECELEVSERGALIKWPDGSHFYAFVEPGGCRVQFDLFEVEEDDWVTEPEYNAHWGRTLEAFRQAKSAMESLVQLPSQEYEPNSPDFDADVAREASIYAIWTLGASAIVLRCFESPVLWLVQLEVELPS